MKQLIGCSALIGGRRIRRKEANQPHLDAQNPRTRLMEVVTRRASKQRDEEGGMFIKSPLKLYMYCTWPGVAMYV